MSQEFRPEDLTALVEAIRRGQYGYSLASVQRNLKWAEVPEPLAKAAIRDSGIFSFMLHSISQ